MTDEHASEPLPPHVFEALVGGVGARTGEDFFAEMVKHVSEALGTKGVWVTEWLPESRRLRALAFWYDGAPFGDYEYSVAGTPCEPVVQTCDLFHVEDRVIELFPNDPDLGPMNAVAYMGIPLLDTDGDMLGHLAVLHDAPLPALDRTHAVFGLFAERAAAELRRLRRDRDLRDREAKLSALVGSAMDAIVELDGNLAVVGMNEAAERVFACDAVSSGLPAAALMERESHERLAALAEELLRRAPGDRKQWVSGGLQAKCATTGGRFAAEATLSSFDLHGRPYFTLILRNVDERLAAEAKIRELTSETASLREELDALQGFDDIVGESGALRASLADVDRVAGRDTPVLITGETGTGKELIARAIHDKSARAGGPLVVVNCAAIAAHLQESDLFGHAKGAFTGAVQARVGRFERAHGGTLFLDEVGEMPADLQAKLLRVLQEGEYERVGSTSARAASTCVVVAATNRDLRAGWSRSRPRSASDLFYRLNVFPVAGRLRCASVGADVVLLLAEALRGEARRAARLNLPRASAQQGQRRAPAALRLAGQRARAAERDRTRADHLGRRGRPQPGPRVARGRRATRRARF